MMKNLKVYMKDKISLFAIIAWVIVVQISMYAVYIPLEGKLVDRYHGADAARDFAAVHARIDQLKIDCKKIKEDKNANN